MIDDLKTVNDLEESSSGLNEVAPQHLLEGLEKTTKTLSHGGRCFVRDSNSASPQQKSRALLLDPLIRCYELRRPRLL
jgi:hypothetical protein